MSIADSNENQTGADGGKPEWAMSKREKLNAERAREGLPPKRRRWPWIVLAVLVIAGVAGFFYMQSMQAFQAPENAGAPVAEPAEPVMQVNRMEIGTIEPQLLEQVVKVTGPLEPATKTQLPALVGGRVETVNVRPGDPVREGDVLVRIDEENLRLQLSQARNTAEATRASLAQAESQLERTMALSQRGVTSSSSLEQSQSTVEAQRAQLAAQESQVEAAEIALRNATVTAPFDGVIASRSVEPNQYINVGTPLLTLVDPAEMEMQAMAPVGSGARIAPGQKVLIDVDGIPGRQFTGEVVRINPVAQEGTRTIPVYVTIANEDHRLRGGMFATGQVVVNQRADGLAVPVDAIREDAEGFYVLVIAGDRLQRQGVELGETWASGRLRGIVSGLEAGQTVVTAPLPSLQAGDKVEIVGGE